MSALTPWARGPFELLLHAEEHLLRGEDVDRRIALISFDNAIEVSIATYLTLNPIQRSNRTYAKTKVEAWLKHYHTKLSFLESELVARGLAWKIDKTHVIWAHDHRNAQYHGGQKGTPEKRVLDIVRTAALWVFSLLFDVTDPEVVLTQAMLDASPPVPPAAERELDMAIDREHGVIDVAGRDYHASELLFALDHEWYREEGASLVAEPTGSGREEPNGS